MRNKIEDSGLMIGIFFIIDDNVVGTAYELRDFSYETSNYVDCGDMHKALFQQLNIDYYSYVDFPRGRVAYDKLKNSMVVITSHYVIDNQLWRNKIEEFYNLKELIYEINEEYEIYL